jgi:hypothetical protein
MISKAYTESGCNSLIDFCIHIVTGDKHPLAHIFTKA